MSWRRVLSRLRALFRRPKLADDLKAEIRSHLDMEERENLESGMPPDEAHYTALRRFGNVTLAQERSREMWMWNTLETLLQDLRYGLRQLRRNPAFTAIAVITLALGIGANTAIFSLVDAVLLHPLSCRDPGRLMRVYTYGQGWGRNAGAGAAPADFLDWKAQNDVFAGMAAATVADFDVAGGAMPVRVIGHRVTPNLFSVLGVTPLLGRTFGPSNAEPGKSNVVVLEYNLWQEAFGARRDILGKTIRVNQKPYTVVGVLPASFRYPYFPFNRDFFVPLVFTGKELTDRSSRNLDVTARLRPSVTVAQAQAEMNAIGDRLRKAYPQAEKDFGSVWAAPLERLPWIWSFVKPLFEPLYAAAILVLAFGCVNIANLLLVRGADREHEMAVRAALGANRRRLVRQWITEGMLLSALGGLAAIVVGMWGADLFKVFIPSDRLPNIQAARLNLPVALLGLAAALIAGIVFSAIPAWKVSKVHPNEPIQRGGRTASAAAGAQRVRHILLLAESTLALLLLFGGGTVLNGFRQLMHTDPGFNPRHVLAFAIDVNQQRYPSPATWAPFFERVAASVRYLPGVASAALAEGVPSTDRQTSVQFAIAGKALPGVRSAWQAVYERVSPNYLKTLENPLEKGRYFRPADNAGSPSVAIVTDTLAHQYFGHQDPIGKLITVWQGYNPEGAKSEKKKTMEIVGIVRGVREYSLAQPFIPVIYALESQDPIYTMMIVLRTNQDPRALIPAIGKRVSEVSSQPIYDVRTIDQRYQDTASLQRVDATIFTGFALITLLLAAIGIYGVAAYGARHRTHEIGIRIALGATKAQILKLVVKQAMKWSLIGVALGCTLLPAFQRFLNAMLGTGAAAFSTRMRLPGGLYEFESAIIAIAFIAAAALLASYFPARRAAKVDPIVAVRYE
jgi:predicted permease